MGSVCQTDRFPEISRKFGVDPVIARLMRNRDQITDEEIEKYLHVKAFRFDGSWRLFKGNGRASGLLTDKIEQKKKIRIIGDYDIDGSMLHLYSFKGTATGRSLGGCRYSGPDEGWLWNFRGKLIDLAAQAFGGHHYYLR